MMARPRWQVTMTYRERAVLTRAAELAGQDVSTYIRECALRATKRNHPGLLSRSIEELCPTPSKRKKKPLTPKQAIAQAKQAMSQAAATRVLRRMQSR